MNKPKYEIKTSEIVGCVLMSAALAAMAVCDIMGVAFKLPQIWRLILGAVLATVSAAGACLILL